MSAISRAVEWEGKPGKVSRSALLLDWVGESMVTELSWL